MLRRPVNLLLLSAFVCTISGQVSKRIDLSTATSAKKFFVVFASRNDTTTGHAFVVWGVEDGVRRCSSVKAFGLYPESDSSNCKSVVGRIPGRIVDEKINHSVGKIAAELIVQVDENYFTESLKVANEWDCKHDFSLISRDCVEFLRAVGNSLHLAMPQRSVTRWTPHAYVQALLASVRFGTLELEDAVYQGPLMNHEPMGHGTLIYNDGSKIDATFWGLEHHVESGLLNNLSGYRYEGGIVDYKAHGMGTVNRLETHQPVFKGRFAGGTCRCAPAHLGPIEARRTQTQTAPAGVPVL